jgi:LysM repeat protein
MDELGQSITQNLLDTLDQASKEMANLTNASTPPPKKSSGSTKSSSSGSSHKSSSGSSHSGSSSSTHKSNRYYTVRKGDTLSDIAEKYYGHGTESYWEKIAKANHLSNPNKIYPGERLLIPYDTGGYTGSFDGGRIALLHQKELVLNQHDTSNMLKMVNLVRDMMPKLDLTKLGDKIGSTINMPITIQNLNGTKEGALEFLSYIGNQMKIRGVNN